MFVDELITTKLLNMEITEYELDNLRQLLNSDDIENVKLGLTISENLNLSYKFIINCIQYKMLSHYYQILILAYLYDMGYEYYNIYNKSYVWLHFEYHKDILKILINIGFNEKEHYNILQTFKPGKRKSERVISLRININHMVVNDSDYVFNYKENTMVNIKESIKYLLDYGTK